MLNKAIIDLNVIRKNAKSIKNSLNQGVKFCAVVKADAYGHGAEMVANAIYDICDCYAVSLVEEGARLRRSGIDKDILLLIPPCRQEIERCVALNLTMTIQNKKKLRYIDRLAKSHGKTAKIHIPFNTGMNRLGLDSLKQLQDFIDEAKRCQNVNIEGLFSHYANPQSERMRKKATERFLLAIKVVKSYNSKVICHISASGGLLAGEQMDMVRVGILLYGYYPFDKKSIKVKPALTLKVLAIGVRNIKRGEGILYGKTRQTKSVLAQLIRFGYADGLIRRKTKGQLNNRCMDISALKKKSSSKRWITLPPIEVLAKQEGTITYEILTKITMRAQKIYKK